MRVSSHQMDRFVHPGTTMSPEMVKGLKTKCSNNDIAQKALKRLIAETPLTYVPQPLDVVDIGYNGVGKGHKECTQDGEQAYSAALAFWATENIAYAHSALNILKAWATVNKVWKGDNAILEASWSICSMARAAELLKYAPGTSGVWATIEPVFFSWLDAVIMPVLRDDTIWRWDNVGNWHFSCICARMQLAILREDFTEWNWCVKTYPTALNKALVWKLCPGQTSETTRDCCHAMFQIGGMTQVPEIAWHQGIDLYDDRLVAVTELQASIQLHEIPAGLTPSDIHTLDGWYPEPVFELPYAHFYGRKHIPMPKTQTYLSRIRPEGVVFHWGAGTLTHASPEK
jgi:Alginate lyase